MLPGGRLPLRRELQEPRGISNRPVVLSRGRGIGL